jgi:hypothetical protein
MAAVGLMREFQKRSLAQRGLCQKV